MRIVLATDALGGLGGSETYAMTVADQLQRLGHDVHLYAQSLGEAAADARALGLRVVDRVQALPDVLDVAIVQDGAVAADLAAARPTLPQVFVAHSDVFDLQLPLQIPGLTVVVVALYDRVERRIRALAQRHEVVRLNQPVDVTRFVPLRPLSERPRVALALGNYLHGERLAVLEQACAQAGVELRTRGLHSAEGPAPRSEVLINEADVVFGKARVIVEALACGRAAYVYDHNGAEGWVTGENHAALARDNFGGQAHGILPDADRVASDLAGYDPSLGLAARDLAVAHHAASAHAAALVEVLRGVVPRPVALDGPWVELARTVRTAHRADVRQFVLQSETARLGAEIQRLHDERRRLHVEVAAAASAREQAQQAAEAARAAATLAEARAAAAEADAADARTTLAAVAGSVRWRLVQAVLRPLDRARRRRERPAAARERRHDPGGDR